MVHARIGTIVLGNVVGFKRGSLKKKKFESRCNFQTFFCLPKLRQSFLLNVSSGKKAEYKDYCSQGKLLIKLKKMIAENEQHTAEVSVIIPVKNGEKYLCECFQSILAQTDYPSSLEVSIYDDGSNDGTQEIINSYQIMFEKQGIQFTKSRGEVSGGVGYAKNRASQQSKGRFLCFLDADDIMLPDRIAKQYTKACEFERNGKLAFIGSCFERLPKNSTERYTRWACNLTQKQLYTQIYTAFGPTLIAPTWFISRQIYTQICGFNESLQNGFPEDLDFFYKALPLHVQLCRIEKPLLIYRYHSECVTFGVNEKTIWDLRIKKLEEDVLPLWSTITIWNAGKQGKRLYKSLSPINQLKVIAFCDVDEKKIQQQKNYEVYDDKLRKVIAKIPIISYKNAQPPAIIAVKLDMTNGQMEEYLENKRWIEFDDYIHFS